MTRMNSNLNDQLQDEIRQLQSRLDEANDTLDAIRNGQIDALVVNGKDGHSLYTLRSADQAYRVFIEQMNEGAVTLNSSGLIVYSNSRFASLVNQPLSKVLGNQFSNFITEDCKTIFEDLFERGWRKNVKSQLLLVPAENPVPVQLSLNVLELEEETALSIIITDLTLQKENERQLMMKNKQLESLNEALLNSNHDLQQFASVASHDLQEPIRKIQVFSKFLKDRAFDELSEQSKVYVDKIITCTQRMKILIIDILTYSRLSANDSGFQPVNLRNLFEEIIEDFDLRVMERNARIELGELPVVEGNKGQLRQVFHNLISNALKFTLPDKSPIIIIKEKELDARELGVSLINEKEYCRISIKDNGIGFDEKFAYSIFSLFEKLNPKSSFEGSGIGLSIAKKIIDKHHGLIIAKSTIGKGSEFNIILPYKHSIGK
jgi:PAS domain S-box-containing protein